MDGNDEVVCRLMAKSHLSVRTLEKCPQLIWWGTIKSFFFVPFLLHCTFDCELRFNIFIRDILDLHNSKWFPSFSSSSSTTGKSFHIRVQSSFCAVFSQSVSQSITASATERHLFILCTMFHSSVAHARPPSWIVVGGLCVAGAVLRWWCWWPDRA